MRRVIIISFFFIGKYSAFTDRAGSSTRIKLSSTTCLIGCSQRVLFVLFISNSYVILAGSLKEITGHSLTEQTVLLELSFPEIPDLQSVVFVLFVSNNNDNSSFLGRKYLAFIK